MELKVREKLKESLTFEKIGIHSMELKA